MTANLLLFKITLLVYFVATICYLIGVISRKEGFRQSAVWILISGFGVHCVTIVPTLRGRVCLATGARACRSRN